MTRLAYNLGSWDPPTNYSGEAPLTQAQITADAATFQNARLWDYRPLGDTIGQLQTVRKYYTFVDVDTDRYLINGGLRQLMLSARELDLAANPDATGFVNQRIIYTHGIGLVMVPVNEVTSEGQPVLFVKDLPPVSVDGAPTVTQPRIYFGEKPTGYVIVGAKQPEFDYPQGAGGTGAEAVTTTVWSGTTGIPAEHDARPPAVRDPIRRPRPADQRPGHLEQPDPHPSIPRRPPGPPRALPPIRQGPLRRRGRAGPPRVHPGRFHGHRQVSKRAAFRTLIARDDRARLGRLRLHPQQRQDRHERL